MQHAKTLCENRMQTKVAKSLQCISHQNRYGETSLEFFEPLTNCVGLGPARRVTLLTNWSKVQGSHRGFQKLGFQQLGFHQLGLPAARLPAARLPATSREQAYLAFDQPTQPSGPCMPCTDVPGVGSLAAFVMIRLYPWRARCTWRLILGSGTCWF